MAGGPEGKQPRFDRTPQQPRQPDQTQPSQGRAAGRESLQGPTTVDRIGPFQYKEVLAYNSDRAIEELRALYEKDPKLFATRTLEALVELWEEKIPDIEHYSDRKSNEAHAFMDSSGYTREKLLPHGRLLSTVSENAMRRGYVQGLKAAFRDLYIRITENVIRLRYPWFPEEGRPEGEAPRGTSNPKGK
jgi:hypothetical protein